MIFIDLSRMRVFYWYPLMCNQRIPNLYLNSQLKLVVMAAAHIWRRPEFDTPDKFPQQPDFYSPVANKKVPCLFCSRNKEFRAATPAGYGYQ